MEILCKVTAASLKLRAAKESLAVYTPALLEKLKAGFKAAALSYSGGRTPLSLCLESQRTYFDTQADYFETLQKLFGAQAELESALGISLDQLPQTTSKQ